MFNLSKILREYLYLLGAIPLTELFLDTHLNTVTKHSLEYSHETHKDLILSFLTHLVTIFPVSQIAATYASKCI